MSATPMALMPPLLCPQLRESLRAHAGGRQQLLGVRMGRVPDLHRGTHPLHAGQHRTHLAEAGRHAIPAAR